jgi:hypothetical protein
MQPAAHKTCPSILQCHPFAVERSLSRAIGGPGQMRMSDFVCPTAKGQMWAVGHLFLARALVARRASEKGDQMNFHFLKYVAILGLLSAPAPAFVAYVVTWPEEVAAELAYRQMADDYSSALLCEPGVRRETHGRAYRCIADQ